MIEIEVAPSPRVGKALRVLDGHICAIERAREIPSSRRLLSRAIRVFPGQCELQLLEQDCAFGKYFRLLVYLVRSRFHVDIVIFREAGLAIVERIGGQRRSDINPFMEVLGQNQFTGCGVLRQISWLVRVNAAAAKVAHTKSASAIAGVLCDIYFLSMLLSSEAL